MGASVRSDHDLFAGASCNLLWLAHDAIVLIDPAQTIVAMNPAAERLLGCPASAALGTSLARFVPPGLRERHGELVRGFSGSTTGSATGSAAEASATAAANESRLAHPRRILVQRADGSTVPADVSLSRVDLFEPLQPRTLYAALLRDASNTAALEERLASLERRMRAVFELSPSPIWICESERLVFANRAAARLFDVQTVDTLLGRSVWSLLDPRSHEPLRQELDLAQAGATSGAIVAGRLLRPDGRAREVEIALAALPDHGTRTVQLVLNDITERQHEAAELERSRRALRLLSRRLDEAREEERRRIARELHDELGQHLTALKMDLANLAVEDHLAHDDPRVAAMQAMLDDTLSSVRRIASDLRPLMLDDLGLNAAIEWQASEAARRMGIRIQTRLPPAESAMDRRVATALYRAVQEALTNIARHAKASLVRIDLRRHKGELILRVSDNGIGLGEDALVRPGSSGLLGLRERAQALGGLCETGPASAGGTLLTVRLPAHPAASVAGSETVT